MAKVFKFAIMTSRGIYTNDLFYTCSVAIQNQWFHHARVSGPWLVPVICSTESPEYISVIHGGEICIAYLLQERFLDSDVVINSHVNRETS